MFHTCVGVADYMRVAARHGGRFVFSYRGGIPGIPPKTPKNGQDVDFGYPPKNRVFGVQNARMAGLVVILGTPPKNRVFGVQNARMAGLVPSFSNFSKKSVFDKRGGDPPRGGPRGDPPSGGPPINDTD